MARDLKTKIRITADTKDAERGLKKTGDAADDTSSKFGGLKVAALAVVAAFVSLGVGLGKALAAFGTQQDAVAGLDAALSSLGEEGKQVSLRLQGVASDLQKTTRFGDETTLSALGIIAAFTKEEEQIEALIKASADLAAGQGISLVSAASLVSRSFATSTNALTRQGVEIEGVAGSTERLTSTVEGIAKLYEGRAAAAADTFFGAQDQLNNALGDSVELIGAQVDKVLQLERTMRIITEIIQRLNDANKEGADATESWSGFIVKQSNLVTTLSAALKLWSGTLDLTEAALDKTRDTTGKVSKEAQKLIDAWEDLVTQQDELTESTKEQITEQERLLKVMVDLGHVVVPDLTESLAKNDQTIRDLGTQLDAGVIKYDFYLTEVRKLEEANLDLFEAQQGTLRVQTDLTEQTTDFTEETRQAVEQVDALTEAEVRNADAVVESSARRIAARRAENPGGFAVNAITGGFSSFATIGGGEFGGAPPQSSGSPNGRVET